MSRQVCNLRHITIERGASLCAVGDCIMAKTFGKSSVRRAIWRDRMGSLRLLGSPYRLRRETEDAKDIVSEETERITQAFAAMASMDARQRHQSGLASHSVSPNTPTVARHHVFR
jgi:hypothetical protein